jgi:hypothetical protein
MRDHASLELRRLYLLMLNGWKIKEVNMDLTEDGYMFTLDPPINKDTETSYGITWVYLWPVEK